MVLYIDYIALAIGPLSSIHSHGPWLMQLSHRTQHSLRFLLAQRSHSLVPVPACTQRASTARVQLTMVNPMKAILGYERMPGPMFAVIVVGQEAWEWGVCGGVAGWVGR